MENKESITQQNAVAVGKMQAEKRDSKRKEDTEEHKRERRGHTGAVLK